MAKPDTDVRSVDAHYQLGATVSEPINLDPPVKPGDTLMVAHHFHHDDKRFLGKLYKDSTYSVTAGSAVAYIDIGANDMDIERSEDEVRASHQAFIDRLKATTGKTPSTMFYPISVAKRP